MRYSGLVLGFLLTCATSALAQQNQQQQQPQQPALQLDNSARLDAILARWEAKMAGIKSLRAQLERQDEDKVFGSREMFVGSAHYQSPNLARLDLKRNDNPSVYECIVCTGQFTFQFVPAQKQVRVYDMGPAKKGGQIAEDNFLSFLIGMKAADAKRRYEIKLTKEDANYVYLLVKPRNAADLADFSTAELALWQKDFLPRMLIYTAANGNKSTWNIPFIEPDVALDRKIFQQPATPPGFQLVRQPRVDAKPDPRVIRQQGPN